MTTPAFNLESVSVKFGNVTALQNVSVRFNQGEQVAFVGPSGAGKTTLLRLLCGSATPISGRQRLLGEELAGLSAKKLRRIRSRIGFVHQQLNLIPNVRVIHNVLAGRLGQRSILAGLKMMVWPSAKETSDVFELLEQVGSLWRSL